MQCTNCKSEILATAKFCPECGYKVENIGKTCPNKDCNRTGLPLEAMFCPDCGTKLHESEIVVSQNSTPNVSFLQTGFDLLENLHLERLPINNSQYSMYSNDIDSPYSISEVCIACGSCIDECPVEAISEGNIYTIDADLCTECASCVDVCPVDTISQLNS